MASVAERKPLPSTDRPVDQEPSGTNERVLELVRRALKQERLEQEKKQQRQAADTALERDRLQAELEVERRRNRDRREARLTPNVKPTAPSINYGAYHALVIGINDYKTLPKLKTAVIDARAVAATLEEYYGYRVNLLVNPTRSDIIDAFDDLRETLTEDDNLLIYYAGHGWLDREEGRGYWLPVNAREDRRSRWFANADLTSALKALFAKHVMVVADSCYSGTLTRSAKVRDRTPNYLRRMAERRVRVVLSSGGLEPVEDSGGGRYSVFAAQFLKALRNNKAVMDGVELFQKVRRNVMLNAAQTPQYSDIRFAGHEGGDFLFVRTD